MSDDEKEPTAFFVEQKDAGFLLKVIPAIAFGPLGRPHDEDLRFWRLIDERVPEDPGWQRITLACGHRFTYEHMPETQEYAYCGVCKRLDDCSYCGGTGEVAESSTRYMACPACSRSSSGGG